MYVVSFYSFKGGVGRSMALVNIGAELARSGRRVLLVDFDLEAPGLDTFGLIPENKQGVVDYVTNYLALNEAPDLAKYVSEASVIGDKGGHLWIMPAGNRDDGYGQRL